MRRVWHSSILITAGMLCGCPAPTKPIVFGGMQELGWFLEELFTTNVWPWAAPLLAGSTVLPIVVVRIFGPSRSWYPVRTSALFVLTYVLFLGAFYAVVLRPNDTEFVRSFLVFFWPSGVVSCLPMLALAILGVHLWAGSDRVTVYAVALLVELILHVIAVAVDWDPIWDQQSWLVGQVAAGVGLMVLARAKRTSARAPA